jgi:V8-like Glu-specific endopeptidase
LSERPTIPSSRIPAAALLVAALGALAAAACKPVAKPADAAAPSPDPGDAADGQAGKTCGKAALDIVNGATTTRYPAVVLLLDYDASTRLLSLCTGTFIGHNALLTASHCVTESGKRMRYVKGTSFAADFDAATAYANGVAPLQVLNPSKVGGEFVKAGDTETDLALLVFPDHTAPATLPLATRRPSSGDAVTLVGFGRATQADNGGRAEAIYKRIGDNTYHATKELEEELPGLITLFGPGDQATGGKHKSLTGEGDSGGPLLLDDTVVGVTSSGGPVTGPFVQDANGEKGLTMYASAVSPFAKDLVAKAKSAGAAFQTTASTVYADKTSSAESGNGGKASRDDGDCASLR